MTRVDHPIHRMLGELVTVAPGDVVADLGCGQGGTLLAIARQRPSATCVGLDRQTAALALARKLLGEVAAPPRLVVADLSGGLPLRAASVDVVVSHNVLECLPEPSGLLDEVFRVLRPGGRAVWSHTDFDAMVINTADADLTRRVVHAYADCAQAWMDSCNGQMGRKLAGLVRRSPLVLDAVHAHQAVATELAGDARSRVDEIVAVLTGHAAAGDESPTSEEIVRWATAVETAATAHDFFFAETAFIAVCHRPP